ncbi:double zinc ribbon domain-containing protein, partial [Desertihabitans aurantiacus]|uniref:double zinc ribbon domain-containing protein n=1 Tax=Desertihabitans aurantiacus TaxID=2282477 RepID=UPI002FCD7851
MTTCPQGHQSTAEDYCDVCGAPIQAGPAPAAPSPSSGGAGTTEDAGGRTCPHCSAGNAADALFCEACGYDFTTGTPPR